MSDATTRAVFQILVCVIEILVERGIFTEADIMKIAEIIRRGDWR